MNANDFLTRQFCWQVYVVVVYREVNFVLSGAQQTPICEYGHSSMDVVVAGCGVLLDENQVTHHHGRWLRLKVTSAEERNRTTVVCVSVYHVSDICTQSRQVRLRCSGGTAQAAAAQH